MIAASATILNCLPERAWQEVQTSRLLAYIYTDRVEVRAGLLTPFIWAYASLFYRWRQHRWRQLIARGFVYED